MKPRGFQARPHRARGAPAGAEVGLYVDLQAAVNTGDFIETRTGRRYIVVRSQRQERGKHAGRQHLRAVVMDQTAQAAATVANAVAAGSKIHRIRWYKR